MKVAFVLALCVVAVSAQFGGWDWNDWGKNWKDWFNRKQQTNYVIDYIHSYRFEEHRRGGMKLLVAVSDSNKDKSCHVIEISDDIEPYLTTDEGIEQVTEDIYDMIKGQGANETTLSRDEIRKEYGDYHLLQECIFHDTYKMVYEPSFNLTSSD